MNDNSARISKAIANTKELVLRDDGVDYYHSTLNQRTWGHKEQAGSVFDPDWVGNWNLDELLEKIHWEVYKDCPNLLPGTTAFIVRDYVNVVGYDGIVPLENLPPDVIVTIDDRKNTGNLSCTFHGAKGRPVHHAVLILGDEGGKEVVFTVHPGDPVMPPTVASTAHKHGDVITVAEARELGFKYAKLV